MKCTIKHTFRNIKNKPIVSFLNIIGLSVSLILVIILSTYCYSELTTDTQHIHGKNIYLVKTANGINTPSVLKENIDLKVPEVKKTIRIVEAWKAPVFKTKNSIPVESNLIFSDPEFFKFFTYKAMEGNLKTALDNPYSIVITEKLKTQLFGKTPALGKTIKYNNKELLTVTAVVREPKENSFLKFNAVTSVQTKNAILPQEGELTEWGWSNRQSFVWLNNNVNISEVTSKIHNLYPKKQGQWVKSIHLCPLKDIYFGGFGNYGYSHFQQGDKNKVFILLLVAILILVIALVNFIHITSAQWSEQILKTGILKVNGASRFSIIKNLVIESFLLIFIAILIAIPGLIILSPVIQNYTGIIFNIRLLLSLQFIFIAFVVALSFSIVLSMIPGLKISSSNTVYNLKKSVTVKRTRSFAKGGMVSLQLIISVVLISFTLLVIKQIKFSSDNLVFNQNNSISIKLTDQIKNDVLKEEINKIATVNKISFTEFYPGNEISNWGGCRFQLEGEEQKIGFSTFNADANFFDVMGLKLIIGKFYPNRLDSINNKVIVNEEFLKFYNIKNPVGGVIMMGQKKYEITGVIQNFHYQSFETPIYPLVIINDEYCPYCIVHINTHNFETLDNSLNEIKNITSEMSPSFPVEISFLDEAVNHMYEKEVQFRRIFSLFSISAIIICALGILAMSIFAAQNRIKEIGIRKVNGAKATEVMHLLNKDIIKWVIVSFTIATPLAWFAMHKWLENFTYKTTLNWWLFALSGMITFGIALLTVSWQSWRAATMNPVEALRDE